MPKRKNIFSTIGLWLITLRRRLLSRVACFVWGAIFGHAVLLQPIEPLHLLLGTPENMLSDTAKSWLLHWRSTVTKLSKDFFIDGWQEFSPVHPDHLLPDSAQPTAASDQSRSTPVHKIIKLR